MKSYTKYNRSIKKMLDILVTFGKHSKALDLFIKKCLLTVNSLFLRW